MGKHGINELLSLKQVCFWMQSKCTYCLLLSTMKSIIKSCKRSHISIMLENGVQKQVYDWDSEFIARFGALVASMSDSANIWRLFLILHSAKATPIWDIDLPIKSSKKAKQKPISLCGEFSLAGAIIIMRSYQHQNGNNIVLDLKKKDHLFWIKLKHYFYNDNY